MNQPCVYLIPPAQRGPFCALILPGLEEELSRPETELLAAVEEDTPLGALLAVPQKERYELLSVFVSEPFRGMGLARILLEAARMRALELGCSRLTAACREAPQTHPFLLHAGFPILLSGQTWNFDASAAVLARTDALAEALMQDGWTVSRETAGEQPLLRALQGEDAVELSYGAFSPDSFNLFAQCILPAQPYDAERAAAAMEDAPGPAAVEAVEGGLALAALWQEESAFGGERTLRGFLRPLLDQLRRCRSLLNA